MKQKIVSKAERANGQIHRIATSPPHLPSGKGVDTSMPERGTPRPGFEVLV